ncbi:MAG: SDR family oxidoreductase [Epsilonproteobacteria bacterium]|nr:SDR family oxidoreductase [Campylobacterota bacterium]
MKSRVILITGCSSGIGYHCALGLRDRGYRVFATARKEADVERLSSEGFESFKLDLDDSQSIQSAVDEVLKRSENKLYALFNNGAYGQPGAVEDLHRDVLRSQFETNIFGTQELTNLLLPVMRQQGEGRIIQNSSILGFVSMQYRGAYNASKYALEGLSDTLRQELVGSNVYVSLIEPGPIRSDFRKNALAKFSQNIDTVHSAHQQAYKKKLKALESEGDVPFTLGPDAVLKSLIKALESKRPKARYRVTFPTKIFWYIKRLTSTRLLDRLLRMAD